MTDQQQLDGGPLPPSWRQVRSWPVWSSPPLALGLILLVIAAAAALVGWGLLTTAYGPDRWALTALITAMAVVHTEVVLGIEQIRKRTFNTRPTDIGHIDMTSVWTFAGAVILPAPLAALATFVILSHLWVRVLRPAGNPAYRALYSRATSMLACFAAAAMLSIGPVNMEDGVPSIAAFAIVALTLLAYMFVNSGLVIIAITLARRSRDIRPFLGSWYDNGLELSSLGLGAVIGLLLSGGSPWMVVFLFPLLIILHRAVAVQELERSADTDTDTQVLNSAAWHREARRALRRLARRRQSAALVLIDIDGFSEINSRYGHDVGDLVLAAAGDALRATARADDVLGRYGVDCFGLLLVGVEPMQIEAETRRYLDVLSSRDMDVAFKGIAAGQAGTVSASAGAARFPEDGLLLEDQLRTAERTLRSAKASPGSIEVISAPRAHELQAFRRERARRY